MSGLPPGNYYIRNDASDFYLSSDGEKDRAGTPIETKKKPVGNNQVFTVLRSEQTYTIQAAATGSFVAYPPNATVDTEIVWASQGARYTIVPSGSKWNIRLVNENLVLYDDNAKAQPKAKVLLKRGPVGADVLWVFEVAS